MVKRYEEEPNMFKHHKESIEIVTEKLSKDPEVLAVLVAGSIAHGLATAVSDVDLLIVIPEDTYAKRREKGDLQYFERESCTYEAGYIDGKYVSVEMMRQVAEKGSEPARFAYEGALIAYSQISGLTELLASISRYPVERKRENIRSFYAQFEAWKWYCEEALKHKNQYLLNQSISNFILFSGRLILAHNELLYPYHKWFLRILDCAKEKPDVLMDIIDALLKEPNQENISRLFDTIRNFRDWDISGLNWPSRFMTDVELTWMTGSVYIADV